MKPLLTRLAIGLVTLVGMGVGALAQPAAPPQDAAPLPPSPATVESTPPSGPPGDVITLKNGREIRGFQVLHQTPTTVLLRLSDGIELSLPRNMVASIQYDQQREAGVNEEDTDGALARELKGVKIAPTLNRRLQQPVASSGPREIRNADFIEEIVDLSQETNIPLDVTDQVRSIPPQQRKWTTTLEPGVSFFSILHDDLLTKFPVLAVDYRFNEVVLTTHEALEAQAADAENEAAAEAEALPESEPPHTETETAETGVPPLPAS